MAKYPIKKVSVSHHMVEHASIDGITTLCGKPVDHESGQYHGRDLIDCGQCWHKASIIEPPLDRKSQILADANC